MVAWLAAVALACDPSQWRPASPAPTHSACTDWWLDRAYREGWTAADLELDPRYTSRDEPAFTLQQLLAMADAAHAAAPFVGAGPAARAEEYLRGMADRRFQTFERCCALEDARPLFGRILAGSALVREDLALTDGARRWSPATLWKLRNAVYARHGRAFANVDLKAFFYGRDAEGRLGIRLSPSSSFDESLLSVADRATLTEITAAEAR